MSSDWVSDITGADDGEDDDEEESTTLFEDNFSRLVDNGDVDSLNPQTITSQVGQISDGELLDEAVRQDDREECVQAYTERLEELKDDSGTQSADAETDNPEEEEQQDADDEQTGSAEDGETDEEDDGNADESDDDGSDETDDADGVDESEDDGTQPPEPEKLTEGSEDRSSDPPSEPETDSSEDRDAIPSPNEVGIRSPGAVSVGEAADLQEDKANALLVWGQEGCGKTHVAHTAPEPVVYIDTEGKADHLAEKFSDKQLFYYQPSDYAEASDALDGALEMLSAYFEEGYRGTLVVDSMTKMWDWAKQDYQELAYPSADDPSEVDFKSALQGEDDWTQIKRRHNTDFRDRIIESPYNVVFTAMAKEDYNAVLSGDGSGKPMTPDGEKQNEYVVDDVVRLRTDDDGVTVGDLHKAARTRYSFLGLEWPEWDTVYDAIEQISQAEQAPEPVDVTQWDFDVVEGQPVQTDSSGDDDDN